MDEAQARSKISGRIISDLRYADDTILVTESGEELKRLLRGWEAPPSEVSEWVTQLMCQGLGRKNKLNNSSLGTRPRVP